MIRFVFFPCLFSFLFATWQVSGAPAADGLEYLPSRTLIYVHVHKLSAADEKIAALCHLFDPHLPSPWTTVKAVTRLSEGIDLDGSAVLAFLATSAPPVLPAPLVLLPVTDYATFAQSVGADTSGEICRIRVASVEVLTAKVGDHALLMNVEHRHFMQQILATQNPRALALTPEADWMAANEITVVLTRIGISYIATKQWWDMVDSITEHDELSPFDDSAVPRRVRSSSGILPLAMFVRNNFMSAACGLAIDDKGNTRLRWFAHMRPRHRLEQQSLQQTPWQQLLVGFADSSSYLFAGGGAMPEDGGIVLADLLTSLSQQDARSAGRERFTGQDWAQERLSWQLAFAGIRKVFVWVAPPAENDPLLASAFLRLEVDNATAYLESLTKSYELSNGLEERSTSDIKLQFQVTPTEFDQNQGLTIESDLDRATGDANVLGWQSMLTAFTGEDHKLTFFCRPIDEHQVFVGVESKEGLNKFIDDYKKAETGLAQSPLTRKTLQLANAESTWIQLINPPGVVEYLQLTMTRLDDLGFMPQLPIYSSAPPLALTCGGSQLKWQGELILHHEAAKALASFITDMKQLLGQ